MQIRALSFFAVLLTICGSQLWAQTPGAVLRTSGPVLLNGKEVTRSYALFDADKIETLSTIANITQPGANILLGAKSAVAYSKDGLTLSSGSAVISASSLFTAHVQGTTVKPQSQKARFALRETPCAIEIAALDGAVSINDGSRDVVLDSGKSLSLPLLVPLRDLKSAAKTDTNSAPSLTRSAATPNCDQAGTSTKSLGTATYPSDTPGDVFIWATTSASSSALVILLVRDHHPGPPPQIPISPAGP